MTGKIDLPDGQWALLIDPEDVTERKREPLTDLMFEAGARQQEADGEPAALDSVRLMMRAEYAVIAALVVEWSFDLPISIDGVMDLPGRAYKALKDATDGKMTELLPNFGVDPTPDSPTDASHESPTP